MARPAVFADLDFEAALARSREANEILIVDAMAAWCGPCRTMDATTWVDPAVIARFAPGSGAFAIQFDVDVEVDLAGELEIQSMPTLVAFVAGEPFDRLVGGRRADVVVGWVDGIARGERFGDAQRKQLADIVACEGRARDAFARGAFAEAGAEYRGLWKLFLGPMPAPIVAEAARVVLALPAERAAFAALRDAIQPDPAALAALWSWASLNVVIADPEATARWYLAADLPATPAVAELVEAAIFPALVATGRWREAGAAIRDPAETLRAASTTLSPGELRTLAANLSRACHAARRDERAYDLAFAARELDPSPEMAAALATR